FRRTFNVTGVSNSANLAMVLERDDGGVIYLNGREIFRTDNMPAAPAVITYTTPAGGFGTEDTTDVVFLNTSNLVEGVNVIAAEIHQQSLNSPDLSFNLQVVGFLR